MKTRSILAILTLAALPALGETADEFYRQGMAAIKRGDETAARRAFNEALRVSPGHPNARYQLNQLSSMKDQLTKTRKERELASVKLPEVNFSRVSLAEALEALNHMIEAESGKEDKEKAITPNFMVQDPSGQLGEREVSLQLKNIPAKAALDYILQQASATVRYDEHATVVRPAGGAKAATTATEE